MGAAMYDQRHSGPRQLWPELQNVDRQIAEIGVWNAWYCLGLGLLLGQWRTFDVKEARPQGFDFHVTQPKIHGRPPERNMLREQPQPRVVVQLQAIEVQGGRERSSDACQLHLAVGQLRRESYDQRSAAVGVADDQQATNEDDYQSEQCAQCPS